MKFFRPPPLLHPRTIAELCFRNKQSAESMRRYKASFPRCSMSIVPVPTCVHLLGTSNKAPKVGSLSHNSCQVWWCKPLFPEEAEAGRFELEASQSYKMRPFLNKQTKQQPTVAYCLKAQEIRILRSRCQQSLLLLRSCRKTLFQVFAVSF